jgi:CelD/BcsL family acetyltransferase involved in cellulose biosynthesis
MPIGSAVTDTTELIGLAADDPRWAAFVRSHPAATIFHHPAWIGLLTDCYGHRAAVLALEDEIGKLAAGLPLLDIRRPFGGRRWVSLPFTDACPPLAEGQSADRLTAALATQVDAGRVEAIEVRGEIPSRGVGAELKPAPSLRQGQARPSGPRVYVSTVAVHHVLDLRAGPSALFSQFSTMHRRNIRRAEKDGVEIVFGREAADVQLFYRLHLATRRRLGIPIQPRRFFELLARRLIEPGMGFVLSARVDGETVAAAVFLGWNGTLIYKYGASDPRAWEHRPNNYLFWIAIRWAAEHGYHTLDWGRTDIENIGLRKFKSGWGAREEPLRYSSIAWFEPRSGHDLPQRWLGLVIRRSPTWFCRVVGELLYRYAA